MEFNPRDIIVTIGGKPLKEFNERNNNMIDVAKLRIGDRVHYQPDHYPDDRWENGMVKEIPEHTTESVRVVYNCAGEWKNFKNYTSALTHKRDLKLGWRSE